MADPSGIATAVSVGGAFTPASRTPPVLTIQVKPEGVKAIMGKLDDLMSVTKDSEITQKGSAYTFTDKRTGLPLAELDTSTGTLAMYKSPKDMNDRIDSIFVSLKDINKFIAQNRVDAPVQDSRMAQGAAGPAKATNASFVQ